MLKVLPSHISNLIAAGEVVQRPSSVVKELMENAVDAGASQVLLIVNDSGRTLIQVIDNGTGMTEETLKTDKEEVENLIKTLTEQLQKINDYITQKRPEVEKLMKEQGVQ